VLIRTIVVNTEYIKLHPADVFCTVNDIQRFTKGDDWSANMRIVPVNFNTEHKAMLGHCKMILESEGGRIAINPDRFDKLITSLRTAVDNDGVLDKESTSYNDIFDAFRLALKFYHFEDSSSEYE
jgi:hypothetical protein